jgi:hypothetical protein
MSNANYKVMIAVNLNEKCLSTLKKIKNIPLINQASEVDMVHIFETKVFFNELATYSYPAPDQYESIKGNCLEIIDNTANEIFGDNDKIKKDVLFHSSPKRMFMELVEEKKPDLIVTTTHIKGELESIFTSSFTEYLINHAPSDILVLREPKDEN